MKKNYFCCLLLMFYSVSGISQIISTIAGNGVWGFSGDGGQATLAALEQPIDVIVDGLGNVYVADYYNGRVRKIDVTGVINSIAGIGSGFGGGDGGPATAASIMPWKMAFDTHGDLLIADAPNNRIRKINSAGIITTIAGDGIRGSSGDGGYATSAHLSTPSGVAVDGIGNIYISDCDNDRIRKVDATGIITTVAGNGVRGYSGDGGPAIAAQLSGPFYCTLDNMGNLYITDTYNGRIRKVSTSGIISTIAGNGTIAYSGDGGPATSAEISYVEDIAIDGVGNIYISDYNNFRIRKVALSGIITTVAGIGSSGYSGDGGPATAAQFTPISVSIDNNAALYLTDTHAGKVRIITQAVAPITGLASICAGTITTLSCVTSGGEWFSSNTAIATVNSNMGIVTGISSGIVDITYMVTGGYATKSIMIKGLPTAGAITGMSKLCMDSVVSLISATPGGVWTSKDPSIATISTSGLVKAIATGSTVISYTLSNICGTVTSAFPITVYTSPAIITGVSGLCKGMAAAFNSKSTGGLWSSSNTGIASIGSTTGIATGHIDGIVDITYTLPGGCFSLFNFTVNGTPVVAPISGSTTQCTKSTITLTNATHSGYWSSSNTSIAQIGSISGIIKGVAPGIVSIFYYVTNSCGIGYNITKDTVKSADAGNITGGNRVCEGSVIKLSSSVTGGSWSTSNTNAVISSEGMLEGLVAGTSKITYTTNGSCGLAYAILSVDVFPYAACPLTIHNEIADELCLFPNPFHNEISFMHCVGSTNYLFLTASGKCLKNGILDEKNKKISTEDLPPGLYFLTVIHTDGRKDILKIIKE